MVMAAADAVQQLAAKAETASAAAVSNRKRTSLPKIRHDFSQAGKSQFKPASRRIRCSNNAV